MKKILSLLLVLSLIIPQAALAAFGVGFHATSTTQDWVSPNLINGVLQAIAAKNFVATSTTATSTFLGGITGPNNFTVQSSSGWVGIGQSSIENPLDISTTQEAGAEGTIRTAQRTLATLNSNLESGINNGIRGTSGTTYFNGPLDTGTVSGSYQTCINQSTTVGHINHLYCLVGRSNNSGAGATTKEAAGVYANFTNSAGTTTNGYGLNIESPGLSGGTTTNYFGMRINSVATSGTGVLGSAYGAVIAIPTTATSTNVGLAIGTPPTGVSNSLYVASGNSYFGSKVGIGTTTPLWDLSVGSGWINGLGTPGAVYTAGTGMAAIAKIPSQTISVTSTNTSPMDNIGLALHNGSDTAGAYAPALVFSKYESDVSKYNSAMAGITARAPVGTGTGGYIDGEMGFWVGDASTTGLRQAMTISNSQRVGIGSTTPYAELSVTNVGSFPSFMVEDSTSPDITPFTIDASGNVGIATTSANRLLQIRVPFSGSQDNGVRISTNAEEYSLDAGLKSTAGGTFRGALTMNTGATAVEAVSITPAGLVGFGTTTPTARLHAVGTDGATYPFAVSGNTKGLRTVTNSTSVVLQGVDTTLVGSYQPLTFGGSELIFQTNGTTERARILSTGNFGIGTNNPLGKLSVSDGNSIAAGLTSALSGPYFVGSASGAFDNVLISSSDSATTRAVSTMIRSRGTLTVPTAVQTDDTLGTFLFGGYDGTGVNFPAGLFAYADGTPSTGSTPGRLSFVTGNNGGDRAERMVIKASGNIGIGTTTPDLRLTVVGSSGTSKTWARNARTVASFENNLAAGTGLAIIGSTTGYSAIFFGDGTSETVGNLRYDHLTDGYRFFTDSNMERMAIMGSTGNVGIATTTPGAQFSLAGGSGGTEPLLLISTSTAAFATSTAIVVDSQGRMGLGTTNPTQALEVAGGIRQNTVIAKPTCDSSVRGTTWFVNSGAGVKDTYEVCAKDAGDAYAWRTLY